MKTTVFFKLPIVILFYVGAEIRASSISKREGNVMSKEVKEEIKPPRPSFPLYMLPSFSLPTINLPQIPYLQGFSIPNRQSVADRIRATKTEYVEVTRRQTVHPVCYTAYEVKSPCLPYSTSDFQDDDSQNFDFDTIHQTNEHFLLNEIKKSSEFTEEIPTEAKENLDENRERSGKYLEFKFGREKSQDKETSTRLEGSEFVPISVNFGNRRQSTEYATKTVLITKLEKYTDRRVTATLLAVNCLPVDRAIPMCQSYPNPIREVPDETFIKDNFTSTPSVKSQLPANIRDKQIISTVNAVKKATQQVQNYIVPSFVFVDRKDSNVDDITSIIDSSETPLETSTDKTMSDD